MGGSPHSTFARRVTCVHSYATYAPPPDDTERATSASASSGGGGGSSGGGGGSNGGGGGGGGPACCLMVVDETKTSGGGACGVRLSLLAVDAHAGSVFTEQLDEALAALALAAAPHPLPKHFKAADVVLMQRPCLAITSWDEQHQIS